MIDAGCGAGAVTVALLRRGAAHVSAWDIVPAAIDDTLENARRHADPARVTPCLGSFEKLAGTPADLLVTNPPQRPRSVWEHLPADARGIGAGGEDGLEKLETILAGTGAPRVITSISTLTAPDLAPARAPSRLRERHGARRRGHRTRPDLAPRRVARGRARPRLGAAAHMSSVTLRRARTPDVPAIHDLIELYARDRILLAKERVQLYEDVQDFWVADAGRARRRLRRRPPAVGGHRGDPHRRRRPVRARPGRRAA